MVDLDSFRMMTTALRTFVDRKALEDLLGSIPPGGRRRQKDQVEEEGRRSRGRPVIDLRVPAPDDIRSIVRGPARHDPPPVDPHGKGSGRG